MDSYQLTTLKHAKHYVI